MAGTHTVAFMEGRRGRRGRIIGKDVHQEGGAPGTTPGLLLLLLLLLLLCLILLLREKGTADFLFCKKVNIVMKS